MAIPLRLGTSGNLQRFDASTPVDIPGALNVSGLTTLTGATADTLPLLDIDQTGTNAGRARVFVGDRNPEGAVTANAGDLYLRDNVGASSVYVFRGTDGTSAGWRDLSTGDVVGPGSATDNAVARFDGTTGKLLQNSAMTLDDDGNLSVSTDGSTPAAPRTITFADWSTGEALRLNLGNTYNYVQTGFNTGLKFSSFHTIIIAGDRNTTATPSFMTDSDASCLVYGTVASSDVLRVRGASSQSGDLQQWVNSSDTVLAAVDDEGNLLMTGKHIDDVATAHYNSWPSLTPTAGAIDVVYDDYQAATVTLNAATVTVELQTPRGPGAFKLIVLQDGTGGRNITWATEGSEVIYAPNGTIGVASTASSRTLVGLIYDGTDWNVVSSEPMQTV